MSMKTQNMIVLTVEFTRTPRFPAGEILLKTPAPPATSFIDKTHAPQIPSQKMHAFMIADISTRPPG